MSPLAQDADTHDGSQCCQSFTFTLRLDRTGDRCRHQLRTGRDTVSECPPWFGRLGSLIDETTLPGRLSKIRRQIFIRRFPADPSRPYRQRYFLRYRHRCQYRQVPRCLSSPHHRQLLCCESHRLNLSLCCDKSSSVGPLHQ